MPPELHFSPRPSERRAAFRYSLTLIVLMTAVAMFMGLVLGGCHRTQAQDFTDPAYLLTLPAASPAVPVTPLPALVAPSPAPIIVQEVSSSARFQTLALGWISAVTAVVLALGYAVARIWPVVVDFKGKLTGLSERLDRHSERFNSQDQTIAAVALGTPPPPPPAPASSTSGN